MINLKSKLKSFIGTYAESTGLRGSLLKEPLNLYKGGQRIFVEVGYKTLFCTTICTL